MADFVGYLSQRASTRRAFLKQVAGGAVSFASVASLARIALGQQKALAPIIVGAPFHIIDTAPHVVAAKLGFFKEVGLTVQLKDIRTGATVIESGLAGDVNVGNSNNIAWIQAISKGIPQVAFLQTAYYDSKHNVQGLLVRKALWDKGELRSPKDLKGKTFAVEDRGGWSEIITVEFLQSVGLKREDVRFVELDYGKQAAAFAGGSIDAAFIPDPLYTSSIQKGYAVGMRQPSGDRISAALTIAKRWYGKEFYPIASTWTDRSFLEKHQDSIKAYYRAFKKAAEFIETHRDDAAKLISEYTRIDVRVLKEVTWSGFDPAIPVDILQKIADKMADVGLIAKKINIKEHVFIS